MGQKRKRAEWFVELIMAARRTSKPRPGTEVDAPRSASEEDAASDTDSDTHSDVSVEIDASAPYWDYLVKWAKYPDKDNSWEPARNLLACEQLILSFWKNVGENLFLTDGQGFEVRASPHWIREQKQNFWHQNSLDEVLEQKRNPKRKRSETLSAPRTPISSPRSTPRRPQSSPRKVTFAPVVDVSVVPSIRDVENTAEWYRTTRRKTYDSSDSEDDTPTGGSTTLSGLKIRIPRRSLPESPVDASYGSPGPTTPDPFSEPPLSSPIVDSNVIRGSPDPATPDLSSEMPPSSPTVHAEPPPSPPPTPPRPARVPWPRVKYIEKHITDRPKLKTKYRLSMAPVAPNIPRASPALVDDTMDVDGDTGPMLLPDSTTAAVPDATDDLGPMLTFVSLEDGEGGNDGAGTGFYASDEDRYPGIRKNGDSMDWTEGVSQLDNCDAVSGVFGANEGDSSPIAIGDVDVDNFLNTQVLPIMNRAQTIDYRPSQCLHPPAPIKKWNWSGRVTISPVDHANTETICQKATLTDSTEPAEPSKPKLASFVLSTKDLNLPRFYDVEDVVILLPTCKPAQQFARLVAEGADKESLHALVEYMDRKGQVAVLPALFDDDDIGHLLFVPPSAKALLTALCVPPELSSPGPSLIAALLFLLSPAGLPYRHPFRYRPHVTVEREILSPEQWRLSVRTEHAYHLALRITGLSASARCFAYAHPSVVWAGPATNPINEADTGHLRRALSKCRKGIIDAAHVGQANDVGTVFIHVGALRTVHALPNLVALRQRPDVHFCSYGTDPAVPPARWRVREIFPLGGVVTFTLAALAGDPWGVLHTIQHIHAHPLWVCYLLPQVVGLAVRLIQASQDDVMQEYTEVMPLAMDRILDALLDGQVALLCAPGEQGANTKCRLDADAKDTSNIGSKDATAKTARDARHAREAEQWALEYVWLRPMNKAALLACCEAACDATLPYAPTSPAAAAAAKNDIIADMYRMQAQPALMDSYRRFVALDLDAAARTREDADGIEWGTVKTFDFNDDFLKARGVMNC